MNQEYLTSLDEIDVSIGENTYTIKDYTNRFDISELLKKYEDVTRTIKIGEDERLEYISYRLYNTTNYWDAIMLLNNITTISQLPVGYDKLMARIEKKYQKWLGIFNKTKTQKQKDIKYEEIKEIETFKNEKFRYLKYIDGSHIMSFQSDVRKAKKAYIRNAERI